MRYLSYHESSDQRAPFISIFYVRVCLEHRNRKQRNKKKTQECDIVETEKPQESKTEEYLKFAVWIAGRREQAKCFLLS